MAKVFNFRFPRIVLAGTVFLPEDSRNPMSATVNMDSGSLTLMILFFAFLAISSITWHFSRSRSILEQWAAKNGFKILHREYRTIFRGPFSAFTTRGQTVYYVTIRDQQGVERSGWVRCGGILFGLLVDKADVQWDDRP